MNEIKIFENSEFGKIRTVKVDGEVCFVASDVAKSLGYKNTSKAISDHCRWVTKRYIPHPQNAEKTLEVNVIPKGDVVRLAAQSELEGAEKFESWIFDEVIPSVLDNGGYIAGQETMSDEELLEKAVLVAQKKIAERDRIIENQRKKIEADKPKTIFADAVATSKTSILVGELAKILRQNGYETGEKRLFSLLRNKGYLISRKGTDYNMPTQRSIEMGIFEIKETSISHSDGHTTVSKTPKVTGKGQLYFVNKFLATAERE